MHTHTAGLTRETITAGVNLAVALAGRASDDRNLAVGGDLLHAAGLALVRLGDEQGPLVRHGDCLSPLQGRVDGRPAHRQVVDAWDLAMDGSPSNHPHLVRLGHLQDDIVVQDVEGVVQRADRQVCGPFQSHLMSQRDRCHPHRVALHHILYITDVCHQSLNSP